MSRNKRLMIAILVSVVFYGVYVKFFMPEPPKQVNQQNIVVEGQRQNQTNQNKTATNTTLQQTQVVQTTPTLNTHALKAKAQIIKVETSAAIAQIHTQGAVLTSYKLRQYHQTPDQKSDLKDMLQETKGYQSLFLGLKGYDILTADKVYEVVSDEKTEKGRKIVLRWYDDNIQVDKIFEFGNLPSDYAVQLSYQVTNKSSGQISLAPYVQNQVGQKIIEKHEGIIGFLKRMKPQDLYAWTYFQDGKAKTNMAWDKLTVEQISGPTQWAALGDRYFIHALVPQVKQVVSSIFQRQDNLLVHRYDSEVQFVAAGLSLEGTFQFYMGPKLVSEMEKMGTQLEKTVDYGWFSFIAKPILWFMIYLHSLIPSWGFVIMTLTFLIKMILHPVNKKSMTSMKAMQQLQPKLKELQAKYAGDKEQQQREMMQLFRTHKVNPMGGCLPMVLQMPVYFALYKVLWSAIELFHAPFLFYQDLSAPDPYFISPILLGIFMFLQQKLTPSPTADSTQKNMMVIMPIMFMAFMLFLPVGLVVYIFVNTVVSVVQQYMIKHDIRMRDLMRGKWQPNGA